MQIDFYGYNGDFAFDAFFSISGGNPVWTAVVQGTPDANGYQLYNASTGITTSVTGTNLTYSLAGEVTGGTITGQSFTDSSGTLLADVSDISWDAAAFYAATIAADPIAAITTLLSGSGPVILDASASTTGLYMDSFSLLQVLGGEDWTISGSQHYDTLAGGTGDDTIQPAGGVGDGFPGFPDAGDFVQGSLGSDIINYSGINPALGGIQVLSYTTDPLQSPVFFGVNVAIASDGTATVSHSLTGSGGFTDTIQNLNNVADFALMGSNSNDFFGVTASAAGNRTILIGGDGDDTFSLTLGTGAIMLYYAFGWDPAFTGLNMNLTTGVVSNDGFGNADTIALSGSGDFMVVATINDDTIVGSARDESFALLTGTDSLDAGAGVDTLVYGGEKPGLLEDPLSLTVNLATGTAVGDYGMAGTSFTHTISNVENVVGGKYGDTLIGDAGVNALNGLGGDDVINGGAGDDVIDGGTGADRMIGGIGSDTFYVDDVGDKIGESRNWAGQDTVISSVDFRMGRSHIENLELTGTATIGAGNGLVNIITGNDGDNILDGGKNNDTLIGGLGNDVYLIRAPHDQAVELAGEGIDAVKAYRSYKLDANVEKLYMQNVFTQAGNPANLNGIGNELDNTIIGTPYDNTIVGREGNDTLKGQAGDDTFVFDRALGPDNVDRIIDFEVNGDDDTLKMKASVFAGMSAGVLAADALVQGTQALDANDRMIFDQASGQLWFDADGVGGADQILVATFEQNAALAADDFLFF